MIQEWFVPTKNWAVQVHLYLPRKFIVDGSFIIEDETGLKVTAKPGDLFYFPKGTSITFSTPNFGLGFFCGQRGESLKNSGGQGRNKHKPRALAP